MRKKIVSRKLESELELLSAEASIKGMKQEEFLEVCKEMFQMMHPITVEGACLWK